MSTRASRVCRAGGAWSLVFAATIVAMISGCDPSGRSGVTQEVSGNQSVAVSAGRDAIVINNHYGVPQEALDRLQERLDLKDDDIADRDRQIAEWANKYRELEQNLGARDDALAQEAREKLQESDLDGAEELFHQSLESNLAAVDRRREQAASDASDLAAVKELQLEYQDALRYREQAVELAPNDTEYLRDLAAVLSRLGRHRRVIEVASRALEIDRVVSGDGSYEVGADYTDLGNAWYGLGQYEKAIEFHEKALAIDREVLGEEHLAVAADYTNLGNAWYELGEYGRAISFHEKALAIHREELGEGGPRVAVSYANLGSAWFGLGEYAKAVEFHEKALAIKRETLGEKHPSVAISYTNLGSAWYDLGEYARAIEFHQKALAIHREALGAEHPSVGISSTNLGGAWSGLGEYQKAIELHEKAVLIFTGAFPAGHPYTDTARENLSIAKQALINAESE